MSQRYNRRCYPSSKDRRTKWAFAIAVLCAALCLSIAAADNVASECRVEADGSQVCPPNDMPEVIVAGDMSVDVSEVEKMKEEQAKDRKARREMEDADVAASAAHSSSSSSSSSSSTTTTATTTTPPSSAKTEEKEASKGDSVPKKKADDIFIVGKFSDDGNESGEKTPKSEGSGAASTCGNAAVGGGGGGAKDGSFWDQFNGTNLKKVRVDVDPHTKTIEMKVPPMSDEERRLRSTPYEEGGLLVENPITGRKVVIMYQKNDGNEAEKKGTTKVQDDAVEYLRNIVLAEEGYVNMYKHCTNRNELCSFWAYMGECYMNEDYMIRDRYCLLACRKCDTHPDYKGGAD